MSGNVPLLVHFYWEKGRGRERGGGGGGGGELVGTNQNQAEPGLDIFCEESTPLKNINEIVQPL